MALCSRAAGVRTDAIARVGFEGSAELGTCRPNCGTSKLAVRTLGKGGSCETLFFPDEPSELTGALLLPLLILPELSTLVLSILSRLSAAL